MFKTLHIHPHLILTILYIHTKGYENTAYLVRAWKSQLSHQGRSVFVHVLHKEIPFLLLCAISGIPPHAKGS